MARAYLKNSKDLIIKWKERGYYYDVIPKYLISRSAEEKEIIHTIYYGTKGKSYDVKALLTVSESMAELNYIGMNPDNKEIQEGKIIIRFTNELLNEVERIDWQDTNLVIKEDAAESNWHIPEEIREGKRYIVEAERVHRYPKLVDQRKRKDNYTCQACGYNQRVGNTYIVDCHHIEKLSDSGEKTTMIEDLVTLCPNCHRVAHTSNFPLSVSDIKEMIKKSRT